METSQDTSILRFQTLVVALLLFAIFGVLAYLLTAFGGSPDQDPRAGLRLEARAAAEQASAEILEPIGWVEPDAARIESAAAAVAARPAPAPTSIVVPGSPTAIEQAAAAPPADESDDPADPSDESGESGESGESAPADPAAPAAE
jgi:hypothetical protein